MRHRRFLALWPLLLAVVFLAAGCSARRIRDAQDQFSRAAAAEQELDKSDGADGLRADASAASGYAVALHLLDQELAGHEGDLRDEDLLGTALVLRALCLWRLEALTHDGDTVPPGPDALADTLARTAARVAAGKIVLGTRDRVLLEALPALRDHDRGLRARDYATAKRFFESAIAGTDAALRTVDPPRNHPVRTYIHLAQMRTLRAWLAANYAMNNKAPEETRAIHERFHVAAAALAPQLETTPALAAQVQDLARALGTTWPRE